MTRTGLSMTVGCALALVLTPPFGMLTRGSEPSPPGATFDPAGSLGQARNGHTATALSDGQILVVGGKSAGADTLAWGELWDPARAAFGWTGSLAEARTHHTATLLSDGTILVIGGVGDDGRAVGSAELWDPASGTFGPAGALSRARTGHTATSLPDGGVLVVGGEDEDGPIASAELWDPASGTFGPAGALRQGRSEHTSTLLSDGRVLVIGGDGQDDDIALAELWDPVSGTFAAAGSLSTARSDHSATLLSDGRVLVVGGLDDGSSDPTASAELWDPAMGDFGPASSLAEARYWHTATLLLDGRVLVVGGLGTDEVRLASTELWDPTLADFGSAATLSQARGSHTATLLPDGRVLVVGGLGENGRLVSAELWASHADGSLATPASTPTASPSPSPEPSRRAIERELANSMGWATWEPYRRSPAGTAFDPFEAGADAGVIFDDLEKELHPAIDYIVLFRFPDARSLEGYWADRAGAAASMAPKRSEPCRDGRPGRGDWSEGEYLCYVSDSGTALLRWTDARTGTYGVMNAGAGRGNLRTLFGRWQSALRGPATGQEPSADASPRRVALTAAERLLLGGIPSSIEQSCAPVRSQVPAGTVAALRCVPDSAVIQAVTYHLMERDKAGRAFGRRIRQVFGDGLQGLGLRCDQGVPSWEPSVPFGAEACYLDDDGRAELRIVGGVTTGCTQLKVVGKWLREPVIYIVVRGEDGDIRRLSESAGRGGGRLWREITQSGAPASDMCPH